MLCLQIAAACSAQSQMNACANCRGRDKERFLQAYCPRSGNVQSKTENFYGINVESDTSYLGSKEDSSVNAHPSSIAVISLFVIIGIGFLVFVCKHYNRKRKEVKAERYNRLLTYVAKYLQNHPTMRHLHSAQNRGLTNADTSIPHESQLSTVQSQTTDPSDM